MNNIDTIMYLIDWNRSEDEQQQGISMAREVKSIKAFFQPFCPPGSSKSLWENCARIVCERSDEELIPYLTDMMIWLEDLNWPGAVLIQQRLLEFSNVECLVDIIKNMVPALIAINEEPWLMSIAPLLKNTKIAESLTNDIVEILVKYSV